MHSLGAMHHLVEPLCPLPLSLLLVRPTPDHVCRPRPPDSDSKSDSGDMPPLWRRRGLRRPTTPRDTGAPKNEVSEQDGLHLSEAKGPEGRQTGHVPCGLTVSFMRIIAYSCSGARSSGHPDVSRWFPDAISEYLLMRASLDPVDGIDNGAA